MHTKLDNIASIFCYANFKRASLLKCMFWAKVTVHKTLSINWFRSYSIRYAQVKAGSWILFMCILIGQSSASVQNCCGDDEKPQSSWHQRSVYLYWSHRIGCICNSVAHVISITFLKDPDVVLPVPVLVLVLAISHFALHTWIWKLGCYMVTWK